MRVTHQETSHLSSLLRRIPVLHDRVLHHSKSPASLAAWLSSIISSVSLEAMPLPDLGCSPMHYLAALRVWCLKASLNSPWSSSISFQLQTATAYPWAQAWSLSFSRWNTRGLNLEIFLDLKCIFSFAAKSLWSVTKNSALWKIPQFWRIL